MTKWKIVVDSGCDFYQLSDLAADTAFVSVPLTIQIGREVFLDQEGLDIDQMMDLMYASGVAASSACPSPQTFLQAYQGAENVIVISLTGALSGSHNAARLAGNMLQEQNPDVKFYLLDSLSAGGEIDLLVLKLNEWIAQGWSFEEVVKGLEDYKDSTKLLFVLSKIDNLVKNGRVSKLLGRVVGLLNIRMVGEASDEGKLELLHKPRGTNVL